MYTSFVDAGLDRICFTVEEPCKFKFQSFDVEPVNNHVAELTGIVVALRYILRHVSGDVRLYTDSKTSVNLIRDGSNNPIYAGLIKEYYNICFGRAVELLWIPRTQNKAGIRLQIGKKKAKKQYAKYVMS